MYEVCAVLSVISAAFGFAMILRMGLRESDEQHFGSLYAVTRSLAILIISIFPLLNRSLMLNLMTAGLMTVILVTDSYIAFNAGHRKAALCCAVLAVLELAALAWISVAG